MNGIASSESRPRKALLYRIAPGIGALTAYQREWLKHDLIAGVSVAAVALPTAIAYAQIIGLEPVAGLYAAVPALLAYAVFGTSRHLIVNPDAATCAMIGAALAPLAAGNPDVLPSLSVVLAIFTGLLCFGAVRCGWAFWPIFFPDRFSSAFSTAWQSASSWARSARCSASR